MLQSLRECLNTEGIKTVKVATGYWDIPGLALLSDDIRAFLSRIDTKFFLLIGKDPFVYASQLKQPKYKDLNYPQDFIRTDINELEPKEEFEEAISLLLEFCTDSDDSKFQIRIFRKNEEDETQFLHSKCYIFDGLSSGIGYGIVGSSNFTEKGLQGNAELNYLETDVTKVLSDTPIPNHKTHKQWFDEKWAISEPWTKVFLEQILRKAPITKRVLEKQESEKDKPFTPYELYIKLLQIIFGDVVDKDLGQQIESYLPSKIQRLEYQIEAVKRCISIMHEHGGFMLADVVGLGKTIIGALIIKRFLSVPEDDGRERKVLIITPPAIQSGWKKTIDQFDKDSNDKISPCIDFITTGSIGNLIDEEFEDEDIADTGEFESALEQKNYGLIIIDESHKFRNSNTQMYQTLDDLIQKIGAETGAFPYIGLLSATPQNNRPNDLKNQIYLFERNRTDSTLKKANSGNIESFFAEVNREYDLLIRRSKVKSDSDEPNDEIPPEERKQRLAAVSQKLRDCVLCDILERRTRTDVKKYYAVDMEAQGIIFPEICGPNNLEYVMDDELATLFSDTMSIIAPTPEEKLATSDYLGYLRYRAIEYFVEAQNAAKYIGRGNRGVSDVSDQLAKIMQIMLVKRLESSFVAFKQSLQNLRRYTQNMIKMWENNTIFVCPQIDINKELDIEAKKKKRGKKVTFDDCVSDIRERIKKLTNDGRNDKGQNAEYRRSDFKQEYITLLREDYALISKLYDRWAQNTEDPKFDKFKESLTPILFNPQSNTSRKLVIFSEAIDTVEALERAVKARGYKVLKITAANRDIMEDVVEANFDANYEGEPKNDYNVIITTEVLAEGVNLHRANVILNYDTPWNSTRLMQRIGRVNRIGSQEKYVYVYNFFPSAQGDKQIQLVRKAHTKLQSFHILFGEDSKIFSDDESVVHYALTQAVDGEESPMEKYVFELKQYKEQHEERYAQIEEANDCWQIAANGETAYFMIKAPNSARLVIRVKQDNGLKSNIISTIDMLEETRTDENNPRVELPDNWGKLVEEALKTYNQYFVRINKSRAGDKQTQAMSIINELFHNELISEKSKKLLSDAMKLVRRGSYDIIRRMIAVDAEIKDKNPVLFKITQEDIDNILEKEIGKLVSNVKQKQGDPKLILGTIR